MNPLGLVLVGLGVILIIIGWSGSQHTIVNAFRGVKGGTPNQTTSASGSSTTTSPGRNANSAGTSATQTPTNNGPAVS